MITTLIAFYQSLPDDFFIVDHDADGYFCYPVAEGLAGIPDWTAPELHREVVVLWNDECTVALVADARHADPRCRILKAKSVVFGGAQ